jgi:hypothetical protein
VPDAREAIYPVVCCALYSSDGEKKVLVLKRPHMQMGTYPFPQDSKMEFYDSEEKLLRAIFEILWDYRLFNV